MNATALESPPLPGAPLHGEPLLTLLARAQALLNPEEDGQTGIGEAERRAAAAELLRQHTLAPANISELGQLHALWLALGEPETANATLHQHRETALSANNAAACAALEWELMDLDSRHAFAPDGGAERLAALAEEWHRHALWPEYGDEWMRIARRYQAWQALEAHVDRDRQQQSPSGSGHEEAMRDAVACWYKAELAHERGDQDALERHFHAALAWMDAGGDKIGFAYWKVFANKVLEIAPQHVAAVLQLATAHLIDCTPPPFAPVRRYRRAHVARLQARAHYALGQLPQALTSAQAGCFELDDGANDHAFAAEVMQWHLEAGHMDKAADLALQGVISVREGWALPGYMLALEWCEQDTSPQRLAWWWCMLAWARIDPRMREDLECSNTAPPVHSADECLARAREHVPAHPLADLIEGMAFAYAQDWPAALPLLERGVLALPELADYEFVIRLWAARLIVLPVDEAIARPFPQCGGASWSYSQGVTLGDQLERLLNVMDESHFQCLSPRPELDTLLRPLAKRCYQEAITCFEAFLWPAIHGSHPSGRRCTTLKIFPENFFSSGEGHYKDGAPYIYAMTCNNLANLYQLHDEDTDAAIALHRKGMTASSLFEQHNNLMCCMVDKYEQTDVTGEEDRQTFLSAFLSTAESFWQESSAHRHPGLNPTGYFQYVVAILGEMRRYSEIIIWIDRLYQWYEALDAGLDEAYLAQCRCDFLRTLMQHLFWLCWQHPEQLRPHLQRQHSALLALAGTPGTGLTLYNAGYAYERCNETRQALALYRLAEARLRQDPGPAGKILHLIHNGIRRCKPWWRLW